MLVALAQLAHAGKLNARLRAIHVDHALQADSAHWARACRELAQAHGVGFDDVRVVVPRVAGQSPEAAAREARYAALADRLEPGEVLLTAHHADDQLETILLQWLRGGGLRSIAGMAPLGRFGATAWHARPLLEFTRDELAAWAGKQGLSWQEDPSNLDRRFDRNYLRLEVLPALRRALAGGRCDGWTCCRLRSRCARSRSGLCRRGSPAGPGRHHDRTRRVAGAARAEAARRAAGLARRAGAAARVGTHPGRPAARHDDCGR